MWRLNTSNFMGYYIETDSHRNKAQFLVDNGPFEAAGIAFSQRELDAFNRPSDPRPKTWLKVPTKEVLKLQPHVPLEANLPT